MKIKKDLQENVSQPKINYNNIDYVHIGDISYEYFFKEEKMSTKRKIKPSFSYELSEKIIDIDAGLIRFVVSTIYKLKKDKAEIARLKYVSEHIFEIQGLKKHVKENKKITVNKILENSLLNLTNSTIRGILYCKTIGTPFSDFILPVSGYTKEL